MAVNARLRYRTEQAAWRSVSIRINIDRKMYQMKHIYNRRNTEKEELLWNQKDYTDL